MKLLNGKEVDPFETLSEEDLKQVPVLTEADIDQIWYKLEQATKNQFHYPIYPRF